MKPKILLCLALVLTGLAVMLSNPAKAKTVIREPALTSPEFWNDYNIYTARIVQVGTNEINITCNVIEPISVKPPVKEKIVAAEANNYFMDNPLEEYPGLDFPGHLAVGKLVVVFEPREDYKTYPSISPQQIKQMGYVKIISSLATDPLMKTLRTIAGIRAKRTLNNLLSHALEKDDTVSPYCLNDLLFQTNIEITPYDAVKLQRIQDDKTRALETRVLAGQLVVKLTHNAAIINAEYLSLKAVIANITTEDLPYSYKFVETLVGIPGHREESITFLTNLAKNPKVTPNGVRAVGYGMESHELFNYNNPDRESDLLFSTALDLLASPTPVMRQEGAGLAFNQCRMIYPADKRLYLERAIGALKAAGKVEHDNNTLNMINNCLAVLEQDFSILYPPKRDNPPHSGQ